ncbi:MAG: hypothetical protein M5U28_19295 [Sandaracinaceae bacterium]|nr:hypothetical protein [Sandaracinaceae bacterium]
MHEQLGDHRLFTVEVDVDALDALCVAARRVELVHLIGAQLLALDVRQPLQRELARRRRRRRRAHVEELVVADRVRALPEHEHVAVDPRLARALRGDLPDRAQLGVEHPRDGEVLRLARLCPLEHHDHALAVEPPRVALGLGRARRLPGPQRSLAARAPHLVLEPRRDAQDRAPFGARRLHAHIAIAELERRRIVLARSDRLERDLVLDLDDVLLRRRARQRSLRLGVRRWRRARSAPPARRAQHRDPHHSYAHDPSATTLAYPNIPRRRGGPTRSGGRLSSNGLQRLGRVL